jgi:hypothetical protein
MVPTVPADCVPVVGAAGDGLVRSSVEPVVRTRLYVVKRPATGDGAAVTSRVRGAKRVRPAPMAVTVTSYRPGGVATVVRIVRTLAHFGEQIAVENRYVDPGGRSLAANSTGSAAPDERIAVTVSLMLRPCVTDRARSPVSEKLKSSEAGSRPGWLTPRADSTTTTAAWSVRFNES